MEDRWVELSYNLFPSFDTNFERCAYEQYDYINEETEEDECSD